MLEILSSENKNGSFAKRQWVSQMLSFISVDTVNIENCYFYSEIKWEVNKNCNPVAVAALYYSAQNGKQMTYNIKDCHFNEATFSVGDRYDASAEIDVNMTNVVFAGAKTGETYEYGRYSGPAFVYGRREYTYGRTYGDIALNNVKFFVMPTNTQGYDYNRCGMTVYTGSNAAPNTTTLTINGVEYDAVSGTMGMGDQTPVKFVDARNDYDYVTVNEEISSNSYKIDGIPVDYKGNALRDITIQSLNQTYIFDSYYKGLNSTFSFGGNDLLEKTVMIKAELYGAENELLATSVYKDVNSLLNAWENQQPTGKFLMVAFVVSGEVEEMWKTTWEDGNPSKDNVPVKVVMTVIDDIGQTHTAEESNITSMPAGTTWEDLFPSDWGELTDTSWFDSSKSSFTINTAAELAGLAELVNSGTNFSGKTINLGADIDLLNLEWIPIGTKDNPFRGKFNGADMEISNLNIDAPDATNAGLFGYVTGGSLSHPI
jgi:hypothetical protein